LKANHNSLVAILYKSVLFIKSKIQFFESKSQQLLCKAYHMRMLFIKSKIQFFESKSQHQNTGLGDKTSCLSSQRYNFLKANHNCESIFRRWTIVVYQVKDTIFWKQITTGKLIIAIQRVLFIKSKIQFFESKSQPVCLSGLTAGGCLSSQRYNFLKANHNWNSNGILSIPLFIKSKIQFFESKSQLLSDIGIHLFGCLSSQRYNFLKANHNCNSSSAIAISVVYQVKDTIFWKQITTPIDFLKNFILLFIKSKIQFFESKSQHSYRGYRL